MPYGGLTPSPPLDSSQFAYPTAREASSPLLKNRGSKKMVGGGVGGGEKDGHHKQARVTKSDSNAAYRKRSASGSGSRDDNNATAEQFFIDVILSRHARKLLGSYRLRDLASFAANLDDYELVQWLRKEK